MACMLRMCCMHGVRRWSMGARVLVRDEVTQMVCGHHQLRGIALCSGYVL